MERGRIATDRVGTERIASDGVRIAREGSVIAVHHWA